MSGVSLLPARLFSRAAGHKPLLEQPESARTLVGLIRKGTIVAATAEAFEGRSWSTWTTPEIIDVDGLPTAYRRGGQGPTVVYLHSESGTRGWFPIHEAFARNVDLIAPEHPGFGDTPLGTAIDSWTDLVLHYDAFFRALDLGTIHLVGDSFGAWIAANLAAYYPDRFASVTLITPLGLRLRDVKSVDTFRLEPEEHDEHFFNGRESQYKELFTQDTETEDAVQALGEATTLALFSWNPRYDRKLDTRLKRVSAPTLVVGVDDDRVTSNDMAARYAELIPSAELTIVHGTDGEKSSHRVTVEQPTDVAELVSRHINENN